MTAAHAIDAGAPGDIDVDLPRFGRCRYRAADVLTAPWGLPGLPGLRRFITMSGGADGFVWLQSLDDVAVALPTADPWSAFAEYAPVLPPYALGSLDVTDAQECATLCVVVPAALGWTMNLLAPIVVNVTTRRVRQITLEHGGYSARTPMHRPAAVTAGG